jgi:hypothetical protein
MNILKKVAHKVGTSLLNFAINEDRSVASLAGAPVDYTISAETDKHKVLTPLKDVLDTIQPNHAEGALIHDAYVQTADNKISAEEKTVGLP